MPGDDATQVGVGLWGAVPVGGSAKQGLQDLPAGPVCLTVWQFDQGYNFSPVPTTVMVDVPDARMAARVAELPARVATSVAVTRFD